MKRYGQDVDHTLLYAMLIDKTEKPREINKMELNNIYVKLKITATINGQTLR